MPVRLIRECRFAANHRRLISEISPGDLLIKPGLRLKIKRAQCGLSPYFEPAPPVLQVLAIALMLRIWSQYSGLRSMLLYNRGYPNFNASILLITTDNWNSNAKKFDRADKNLLCPITWRTDSLYREVALP